MKLLKNWIFWSLAASIIGTVVGYIFLYPVQFGLCTADFATLTFDNSCLRNSSLIGVKLFYPFFALIPIFLILFFIPRAVSAWKKFAVWYVPIIAFLTITGKPDTGGGVGVLSGNIGPTFEGSVLGASAIYIGASLGIIAVALVNDWRKRKGRAPLATLWYWLAAIILSISTLYLFNPLVKLVLSGLAVVQ